MMKDVNKKLVGALLVSLLAMQPAQAAQTFADMPNDWSTKALNAAVDNGLLSGYNGYIRPADSLSRAEFASITVRALGLNTNGAKSSFSDVSSSDWYYGAISKLAELGIMEGDGTSARPNDSISRQEAFTVLSRVFAYTGGQTASLRAFSDSDEIEDWAKDALASFVEAGIVSGSAGSLQPLSPISRAQFAKLMDNLVQYYIDDTSEIPRKLEGNVIIRSASVSLKNVDITGNLILSDNTTTATLDSCKIGGQIVVRGGSTVTANKTTADAAVLLGAKANFSLTNGSTINSMVNAKNANGAKITIDASSKLSQLSVSAPSVTVDSRSKIATVNVDSSIKNSVTVTQPSTSGSVSGGGGGGGGGSTSTPISASAFSVTLTNADHSTDVVNATYDNDVFTLDLRGKPKDSTIQSGYLTTSSATKIEFGTKYTLDTNTDLPMSQLLAGSKKAQSDITIDQLCRMVRDYKENASSLAPTIQSAAKDIGLTVEDGKFTVKGTLQGSSGKQVTFVVLVDTPAL